MAGVCFWTSIAVFYSSEKNEAIMKKLKQLITNHFRKPDGHGKFVDLTEELLPELIQQMS